MSARRTSVQDRTPRDKIALDLYQLSGMQWEDVAASNQRRLAEALQQLRWRGTSPDRYGFASIQEYERSIYGYFSQEYPAIVKQYDEAKSGTELSQPTFVDLVFLLAMDSGFLLLQDRRFRSEGLLTMGESRRHFIAVFNYVARRLGIGGAVLEAKEYLEVAKSEFLEVIRAEEVVELEVDKLAGRSVPDEVVLFNPDVDANRFYKDVWNDYEKENVSSILMKRAPGGNLAKSVYARAASNAGDPKKVQYRVGPAEARETRIIYRRRRTHVPNVLINRPLREDDAAKMIGILYGLLAGSVEAEEQRVARHQQLSLGMDD